MISRRRLLASSMAIAAVSSAPGMAAADNVAAAETFIENQGQNLLDVLGMPPGDDRRAAFRNWIDTAFNLDLIAKLALGPHLQQASPDQLDTYLKAFNEYIVVTYEARFDTFTGYEINVLRGRPAGSKDSIVQTSISYGSDTVPVDFRVRHEDGNDLDVIDVMVSNVSMLRTQQEEFSSVIQRGGIDGLITSLGQLTDQIQAQAGG